MDAAQLDRIRAELFYGIGDYTKNQPDFVADRFELVSPRRTGAFLTEVRDDLDGVEEVLLYVHLPFCFSECVFCNSFPLRAGGEVQGRYLDALLREIGLLAEAGLFAGRRARCIYFGGGTPTAFADADLAAILAALEAAISRSADCQVCTEAHPATLAAGARLPALADLGVGRVSIGCQTFDPEILERCHRRQGTEEIEACVVAAREAGLATSLDMMLGLPGQTRDTLERDLAILDRIRPDAVEYIRHEVVNPGAIALYRERPELLTADDELFAMVLRSQAWMRERGYEQNGHYRSDRFWKYRYHWLQEMPIIACGLRARSYTPSLQYDSHDDADTYCALAGSGVPPVGRVNRLGPVERMYRSLFLGLQAAAGVDIERFRDRHDRDPRDVFAPLLARLGDLGCVAIDERSVRLTEAGATFVEDVCDFILDEALRDDPRGRTPHSAGNYATRLHDGG